MTQGLRDGVNLDPIHVWSDKVGEVDWTRGNKMNKNKDKHNKIIDTDTESGDDLANENRNDNGNEMANRTLKKKFGNLAEEEAEQRIMDKGINSETRSAPTTSKPKNKRGRMELDSSGEEHKGWQEAIVDADGTNGEARRITEKIRMLCHSDPSKRVSRDLTSKIMDLVGDLAGIVMDLTTRITYLKGGNATKSGNLRTNGPNKKYLWTITGMPKKTLQLAQVVMIKPPDDMEKTLKNKIMGLMNPAKEKIKIKGI